MAQDTQVSIKCDLPGCKKAPGKTHDHVLVMASHWIAENDIPAGATDVPPLTSGRSLDFCSWEHAAEFFGTLGKEAAKLRSEALDAAVERVQARKQAAADAKAAREAAERGPEPPAPIVDETESEEGAKAAAAS